MTLETEIYQILKKHRLSLNKREEVIVDLLDFINKREKQLTIHSVSKRFDDQKFIDNVIGSYRHDFGLLDKQEQEKLIFECKEWMRAIKNNEPY